MKYLQVFFLLFSKSTPEEAEMSLTRNGLDFSNEEQQRIADHLELYRQETLKRQIILRDRYYRHIA